jgi:hypothetical protein
MTMHNHFENISFLSEDEQDEIKTIFITTTVTFFEEFKQLYTQENSSLLRKKCHTFGSSLMVFKLDECGVLLQNISKELKLKNSANAYLMFLKLEKSVNTFIDYIKKP